MRFGTLSWLIIVLLAFACSLAKGQTRIQAPLITLDVNSQPLANVLKIIEKQSSLSFSFNPDNVPLRALVTYQAKSQTLEAVLNYLSINYHLSAKIIEKQIVLLAAPNLPPLTFTISGFINDTQNGESLIGATISVDSLLVGTVANGYGYYSLALPYGRHTIQVSYLGYVAATQTIDLIKTNTLNIGLVQAIPQLQEILVRGFASVNIDKVQTGKIALSPKTVAEVPAAFGEKDVIKALAVIPGINLQSEGSIFFYVRGGNKDQNLILIDDAPIYNPTHMLGLFSSIVHDAVNSIDVYKSDFPLAKGGRLSSVIDIKTKEGNKNKFSAWGNLGLVSTQLGIEGPFKKNESSYILSGRLSRIKWLFKQKFPSLEKFQFHDITGKINFKLNPSNKLYFSFYNGADHFFTNLSGIGWTNLNGSIRWNNLINKNTFANTTIYGSNYEYLLFINRATDERWRSRIGEIGIKTDFSHFINSQQELSFGFQFNGRTINPGNLATGSEKQDSYIVSVKNDLETIGYLQHEVKTDNKWGFKYGLRASLWTSLGESFEFTFNSKGAATDTLDYKTGQTYHNYFQVEPKLTASYAISDRSSVKASYGRSVQNLHLITNSISPFTSFEVWLPSGPNIEPQQADQLSLGYYKHLPNIGISLEAESYIKYMYNQIDYAAHASTLLNPTIESELLIGNAKAFGIELLGRKAEGRLRGLVGYTYSRVKSQFNEINNGKKFNAFSDRPHHLNLNLNYDLGLRLALGCNFIYTSGTPFSSPSSFYVYDDIEVPIYTDKNNDRFPEYHRLDFSSQFLLNKNPQNKFKHSLTLSVYNVYGRKNPTFINFNKSLKDDGKFEIPGNLLAASRSTSQTYLYGVTPSLSYHFRF